MKGSYQQNPHSGTWYARVDAPLQSGQKRRQIRVSASTKRELQSKVAQLVTSFEAGYRGDKRRMKVSELLDLWLASKKRDVAFRTYESYKATARLYLLPSFGALEVARLTKSEIRNAMNEWSDSGRLDGKPGTRSATTVRYALTVLSMVLEFAVNDEIIHRNPARQFKRPSAIRSRPAYRNAEGAAQLLHAAQGTPLFVPLLLSATTGLRRGELLGLRHRDIDARCNELTVEGALECRGRVLRFKAEPKTAKSRRTICISCDVGVLLAGHMATQIERLSLLGAAPTPETPVFDRGDGGLWHPDSFGAAYRRLVKKAGHEHMPLHGLRHSFASIAHTEGIRTKVVSESLGHASERLTVDLYTHVEKRLLRELADRVGASVLAELGRQTEGMRIICTEGAQRE